MTKKFKSLFMTLLLGAGFLNGCNPNTQSSSQSSFDESSETSLPSSEGQSSEEQSSIEIEDSFWNVSFDLNYVDAPLIDSVIAKHNTKITAPSFDFSPEDDKFLGWFHDQYSLVSWRFTVDTVTANRTLYAGWQSIIDSYIDTPPPIEDDYDYYDPDFFPTTHTVSFNTNYETGPTIVRHVVEGKQAKAPSIVRPGYRIENWYLEESLDTIFNFDTLIYEDFNLYAKWVTLTTYYVTLDLNYSGAPTLPQVTGYEGLKLAVPPTPTRDNYDFIGWYKDQALTELWSFSSSVVMSNMTLYAKWVRMPLPGVYVLMSDRWLEDNATFVLWHGANTVNKNGVATGIPREYYFDNVATTYLALKRYVNNNMVGQVHSIAASGGFGTSWNQITVNDTTPKTGESVATNGNFVTLGIRDNSVDEDLTKYDVTFNYNYDGAPAPFVREVQEGKTVTAPQNPTRAGYTFLGWYTESTQTNLFNFSTPITESLVLFAGWQEKPAPVLVDVTFNYNYEGSPAPIIQSAEVGELLTPPTVTRSGYTLLGWYKESGTTNKWNEGSDKVAAQMTLYAKWQENSPITTNGMFVRVNDAWAEDNATFEIRFGSLKVAGTPTGEKNEYFFEFVPTNACELLRFVNGIQVAKVYNIATWVSNGNDFRNFGTVWNRVTLNSNLAKNNTNAEAPLNVTYDLKMITTSLAIDSKRSAYAN